MAGPDPKAKATSATTSGFDNTKLPERENLPPALQKIVDKADKDENFYDELWEGT
jgi:fission process protein 1